MSPGSVEILDLEDAGVQFAELTQEQRDEITVAVDVEIRPLIADLIVLVKQAEQLRLAGVIGLQATLEKLADDALIPLGNAARDYVGAKPLTAGEVKQILAGLQSVIRQNLDDRRRVLFAKAVGPKKSIV